MINGNDVNVSFGADSSGLNAGLDRAVSSMRNSFDAMKQAGDTLKLGMSGVASSIGGIFAQLGLMVGSGAIINSIIDTSSAFEQLEIELKAVMGSAENGAKAFEWIKQFAVDTPYSVQETTEAFKMLKNFGLDPMDGTLRSIADAAAKYGSGADAVTRITLALGQAWGRGKLQGQDIMQLINAGIPVWDMLAKATGKNTAELQKMSEKGEITQEIMLKFLDELGKASAGMTSDKMNSFAGSISNLGDAYANTIDNIRKEGAFDFLTDSIQGLTRTLPDLMMAFYDVLRAIMDVVSMLADVVWTALGEIGHAILSVFGSDSPSMTGLQFFINILKVVQVAAISFSTGLKTIFAGVMMTVQQLSNALVTLGTVAWRTLKLDFSGAASAWREGVANNHKIFSAGMDKIVNTAVDGRRRIDNAILGRQQSKIEDTTRKTPKAAAAEADKAKNGKASSISNEWQAELEERIRLEIGFFRDSTLLEAEFWAGKLQLTKAGTKERATVERELFAVYKRIANETLALELEGLNDRSTAARDGGIERIEIAGQIAARIGEVYGTESKQYRDALRDMNAAAREHHQKMLELEQAQRDRLHEVRLGEIDTEQIMLDRKYNLGEINRKQELIASRDLAERKFQIELDYARKSAELLDAGTAEHENALAKIEELTRIHNNKIAEINTGIAKESVGLWTSLTDRIGSLWDRGVNAMMNGTLTWRNAMRAIFTDFVGWFANNVIGEQVKQWAAGQAQMLMVKMGFMAKEQALNKVGAAQAIATKVSEATGVATANAVEAGTGAAASQSSIPIIGPILAIAAMASIFAAVSNMGSKIPSARGGYDIPAGINPLAQLHEEEMVLPKDIANQFRNGGGNRGAVHVHINAVDSRDVARALKQGGALQKALRDMDRRFVR